MYLSVAFVCFFFSWATSALTIQNVTDCTCGYYDPGTDSFFTDSAIVYFNETADFPSDVFVKESYENKYEKGWNSRYVQGSKTSNIDVGRDSSTSNTSLQLYIDPSTPDHLVVGGSVQSRRRDIFYGSFRTMMRSPRSWSTGSAVSMTLHFNESQTINLDVMNPDDPSKAWVGLFMRNEFPDRDRGVNFSVLSNYSINAWEYTEYRIDWSENKVDYYVGGILFRSVPKEGLNYPQTPSPLRLKHWSVGNWFTMQGPPKNRSVADVGWTRMFFNSSMTTKQDRERLALRCSLADACSTDNNGLRGSSPFTSESMANWKQAAPLRPDRSIPKVILIVCGSLSAFLLANAFRGRIPNPSRRLKEMQKAKRDIYHRSSHYGIAVGYKPEDEVKSTSPPMSRPISYFGEPIPTNQLRSSRLSLEEYFNSQRTSFEAGTRTPRMSWREYSEGRSHMEFGSPPATHELPQDQEKVVPEIKRPQTPPRTATSDKIVRVGDDEITFVGIRETHHDPTESSTPDDSPKGYAVDRPLADVFSVDAHKQLASLNQLAKQYRVEYLAGLLSFSCILVTFIQFSLTFSPASIDPGADPHYRTESWTRKTINSYFLNLVWVGPFLMTSARFLVSDYFETGDLLGVAQKAVRRPFRFLIPILAIALLEYFFMDSGAINWLEYMASVTWSTWPFARVPNNFGYFISEILELAYLIPNAAPQITFNYCTGVLWTIPVQLQGSWVTLLGVIVIREIRTPWKRFCYYAFCMLMHWYALSWGTYFYFGIMLADLEINFQYRKWLHARPLVYYPLLLLCALATIGGLTLDMVTQWTKVNYAAWEYGIHPDPPTGQPIMFTGAVGYPQYYVPKLNGIVFAVGLQSLVELSPLIQKMFSVKALQYIFPHIFTIYLLHGFVFWSLGSTIFIYLANRQFEYWQMVTVAGVCCYAALFLGVPILTPVVTTLGKTVTANIWLFANETPSPRKPTLYPFPSNFLFVRQAFAQDAVPPPTKVEQVPATKPNRGRFVKFVAGVAAALSPKFGNNQPCQPEVSLSRSGSLSRPSAPRKVVGWRTGGLSKNVVLLKRNNSTISKAKAAAPRGFF